MAILAILLALVLGTLIGLFVPSSKIGQAFGQEEQDAELVLPDGDFRVLVADESTLPGATWDFVTMFPQDEVDLAGKKMRLILKTGPVPTETFEVAHGGALGFYPYGKLQKAGHLIDFIRKPEVAVDQIEFDVYDLDTLSESGYATLFQQMKSGKNDAFALQAKNNEEPNPYMILMAEQPTVSKWVGFNIPYTDTPFVGTAVVWNQDFEKLLDHYSVGWGEDSTLSGLSERSVGCNTPRTRCMR